MSRQRNEVAEIMAVIALYRSAGYEFFPLHGNTPAHAGWRERDYADFDPAPWLEQGGAVGIRLSADDLIIHCDPRNYPPGVDPLAELADVVSAPLRDAPAIRTGSDELYLFFRKPADLRIAGLSEYEGLDILSEGNFIIGPVPVQPKTFLDYKPEGDIRAVQMAPDDLLKMLEADPYYDQFLDGPRVIERHELAALLRVLARFIHERRRGCCTWGSRARDRRHLGRGLS